MLKLLQAAIVFPILSLLLVSEGIPSRSQNSPPKPEAVAAVELGINLRSQDRTTEAYTEFEHAIRLSPNYPEAYIAKAALLFKQGRSIEAIATYDQALSLDKNSVTAVLGKGQALARQGKREEAKIFLKSAQKTFQENGDSEKASLIQHLLPGL
jgi:tetratricopeptide (TPR) repeat protein